MRTTLNLDDEALDRAVEVSPDKTKTEIINEALREYARRRRLRKLLDFEGKFQWEGNLDELRASSLPRRAEGTGLVRESGVLVSDGEPTQDLGDALERFRQERR